MSGVCDRAEGVRGGLRDSVGRQGLEGPLYMHTSWSVLPAVVAESQLGRQKSRI